LIRSESTPAFEKSGLLREDGLEEADGVAPVAHLHGALRLQVELVEVRGQLGLADIVLVYRCVRFFGHDLLASDGVKKGGLGGLSGENRGGKS
jgi:hypothetical protein